MRRTARPQQDPPPSGKKPLAIDSNWQRLQQALRAPQHGKGTARDVGKRKSREGQGGRPSAAEGAGAGAPAAAAPSSRRASVEREGQLPCARPGPRSGAGGGESAGTRWAASDSAAERSGCVRSGVCATAVVDDAEDAPPFSARRLTRVVALDCEMVGTGREGRHSMLARVSLVNAHGEAVYDKFVRPVLKVVDYRTHVSGVRRSDLTKSRAEDFWVVQKEVTELIRGRVLVGHALRNDLKALLLSHPKRDIRDTQKYRPLRGAQGQARSLRQLAQEVLGLAVQQGEHSSVEDAQAALLLYKKFKKEWERSLVEKRAASKASPSPKPKTGAGLGRPVP